MVARLPQQVLLLLVLGEWNTRENLYTGWCNGTSTVARMSPFYPETVAIESTSCRKRVSNLTRTFHRFWESLNDLRKESRSLLLEGTKYLLISDIRYRFSEKVTCTRTVGIIVF